jgi:hypothetical protein
MCGLAFLRVLRPKSGIYVVNQSRLCADADVRAWTAACARQITEHVAPAYGRKPVRVQFLPKTSHAPKGAWVIGVLDDADQAGALGWHTEDRFGRVYGRVFARPCLDYDVPISTTLSHEIVETWCDPSVDRWVDSGRGYEVAYEACDAVEGDSYPLDGVEVSDFVTPAWYGRVNGPGVPVGPHGTHWCATMREVAPFELAPGGYVVRRWADGHEDQEFGRQANRDYIAAKAHEVARSTRRKTQAARV